MKNLLKITSTILFSLLAIGCHSDNENLEDFNALAKTPKKALKVNSVVPSLNFKLNNIKSADLSKEDNVNKVIELLEEETNVYYRKSLENKGFMPKSVELSYQEVSNGLNPKTLGSSVKTNVSPMKQLIDGNGAYFDVDQKRLLNQCDETLASFDGNNITSVTNSFEEIKRTAQAELSGEKAQIILIASNVGIMTSKEWNKNLTEWNEALTGISDSKKAAKYKIVNLDETTN